MKACRVCGVVKGLSEFYRHPHCADGHVHRCKACVREYVRGRAVVAAVAERARRAARTKEAKQRHYAVIQKWHDQHREAVRQHKREWELRNPDKVKSNSARQKARRRNAKIVRDPVSRAAIFARDGGKCHLCGKPVDPNNWHLDHLIPVADDGEHTALNVAVSHPVCNQRRNRTGSAQLRLIA